MTYKALMPALEAVPHAEYLFTEYLEKCYTSGGNLVTGVHKDTRTLEAYRSKAPHSGTHRLHARRGA